LWLNLPSSVSVRDRRQDPPPRPVVHTLRERCETLAPPRGAVKA
jgi:hypothetical protein